MTRKRSAPKAATPPGASEPIYSLSMTELAAVMIKQAELHDGLYEAGINFTIAVGSFGTPDAPEKSRPGVFAVVNHVVLTPTGQGNPNAVDAAAVNPRVPVAPQLSAPTRKVPRNRSLKKE